jgi:hypothetical protein
VRAIFLSTHKNLEDRKSVPQRLKPGMAVSFNGTAEAMPFLQDRVLTQTLKAGNISRNRVIPQPEKPSIFIRASGIFGILALVAALCEPRQLLKQQAPWRLAKGLVFPAKGIYLAGPIVIPLGVCWFFFSSFALRVAMVLSRHWSNSAISCLCAASSPQSRSALRR